MNKKGITLVALVITVIVLLILAGVSLSLALGDNGVISNAMKVGLASAKGEVRDHLLLILNNELVSASSDIADTAIDMSTRYNEPKLLNFLLGNKNYVGLEHEEKAVAVCIDKNIIPEAKKILPRGENIDVTILKDKFNDDNEGVNAGKIYNLYRLIPENISEKVNNCGKGTSLTEGDIFVLEAINSDSVRLEENETSTGKFQINYYDQNGEKSTLDTVSLYITNK